MTIHLLNVEPAERRGAKLKDARLRERQSRSAATDLIRSQWNERERARIAETCTQITTKMNRLAFRYNPVLIIVEVAMLSLAR